VSMVDIQALGLEVGAVFPALLRALIGSDAESLERGIDLVDGISDEASAVGIFDAQDGNAAVVMGPKPVKQAGTDAADMQITGGAGCKTDANRVVGRFWA
jgi:hypothetical protein